MASSSIRGTASRSAVPVALLTTKSISNPLPFSIRACPMNTSLTAANDLLSPIHDRMPVILPKDTEGFWLDPSNDDHDVLGSLHNSYPNDEMVAFEVPPS